MVSESGEVQPDWAMGVRSWWDIHGSTSMRVAIAVLAVFALLKLGSEFYRLVWDTGGHGAIDLRIIHRWTQGWFAGENIYGAESHANFPPASFAIFWPLMGWVASSDVRWLWAITTVAAGAWLICLITRESGATTGQERLLVALMFLSMNATGVTVGNGQTIIHILPVLLTGLLLLCRGGTTWTGLWGGFLLMLTLVKPSVSIPFLWVAVFVSRKLWAVILAAVGYVLLTAFAAQFQAADLLTLFRGWLESAEALSVRGGYGNVHIWLGFLGSKEWNLPASLLVLVALGFWVYRYRHVDLWVLLGVTALVARLWTYHRVYDDLLILLPEIALFRIAKRGPSPDGSDVVAGLLLALTISSLLIPARLLHLPLPWNLPFTAGHVVIWIALLVFLVDQARREPSASVA